MSSEKAKKLKGKQLFPHEIVSKFPLIRGYGRYAHNTLSNLEKKVLSCQWNDIRKGVIESIEKMKKTKIENSSDVTVNLGNLVSLVDVSGSMAGMPMEVAIAMGLLVSEVASPAYCNRCLTFSEEPTWIEFHQSMSLEEKVIKIRKAPWGMNTDFEKATELLLEVAIKAKLKPKDIPDLIVFSDMQFDVARNSRQYCNGSNNCVSEWETHHERIVRRFKEQGLKACGEEWPTPRIIYWNLRGDTSGFPATGDTPGVTMLSGYSPSLLKLLLSGEPIAREVEEEVKDENGVKLSNKVTNNPYHFMRKALDAEEYDKVRNLLYASEEGILKKYNKLIEMEK